jgi:ribosomal protein S18 acetylase RimI-like enzyme
MRSGGNPDPGSGSGDAPAAAVSIASEVTPELVEAMARLVGQLSRSAAAPTEAELAEIVASPATTLLVARDAGGGVTGTLTLALFRIPTGVRAWIEDVVVDESARGQGTGEALTRAAIGIAVGAGARTVDLTSRPDRAAANRLYRRIGFVQRETNVYRWQRAG